MAKLVDAPASGAGDRKVVEVRVLFWAPLFPAFLVLRTQRFSIQATGCQLQQFIPLLLSYATHAAEEVAPTTPL